MMTTRIEAFLVGLLLAGVIKPAARPAPDKLERRRAGSIPARRLTATEPLEFDHGCPDFNNRSRRLSCRPRRCARLGRQRVILSAQLLAQQLWLAMPVRIRKPSLDHDDALRFRHLPEQVPHRERQQKTHRQRASWMGTALANLPSLVQ